MEHGSYQQLAQVPPVFAVETQPGALVIRLRLSRDWLEVLGAPLRLALTWWGAALLGAGSLGGGLALLSLVRPDAPLLHQDLGQVAVLAFVLAGFWAGVARGVPEELQRLRGERLREGR